MTLPSGLLAELRRIVGSRYARTDDATLLAYESDALTLFRTRPGAVVLPGDGEELQAVVASLHAAGVPFAARGAGTGLSGGALVPEGGVVVGLARMNRILELDPEDRYAVLEPGVVNLSLSRVAAEHGLRYAPDPASQAVCTLGGNVAENAGGPHCLLHGMTTHHTLFVEVVLPNGACETWGSPFAIDDPVDLRGLLLGSEGTLAIARKVGVKLIPLPEAVVTLLAAYRTLGEACDAVSEIVARGLTPVALEVLDRSAIEAVEASVYRAGYPQGAGGVLLVEVEGPSDRVLAEADEIERLLKGREPLSLQRASTEQQRLALWKGRKGAGGAMGRLAPDVYVMDGVVPPSRITEILAFVGRVAEERRLTVASFFHAGDGNIHPNIAYDARDPAQCEAVEAAGREILLECLRLGGSLSGEHGIGLEKSAYMGEQFSDDELALMTRVRDAFNPGGLLNPNKLLPCGRGCLEAYHRHGGAS